MTVRIGLLGPLAVTVSDRPVDPGSPTARTILAVLALRCGETVSAGRIASVLWVEDPPSSARNAIQVQISRLRKLFGDPGLIVTGAGGYRLDIPPEQIDVHEFRMLLRQARSEADDRERSALLGRALALWRGPALAELRGTGVRLARELEEDRSTALADRIDTDLRLGRHRDLLPELAALAEAEPLHERYVAQRMLALHQDGRRQPALDLYQQTRRRLADELGLEPGPGLRSALEQVLAGRSDRAPADLPAAVRPFLGRAGELAELDRWHAAGGAVLELTGTGGIGKTALAIHWSWQQRALFPDGQLYADLRGHDDDPEDASDVLRRFLRRLGVAADEVPPGREERAALFRTRLAGRRVLLLLDNAASSAQVRPLLPGAPGCVTVVTGRTRLDGLVARNGARRLVVPLLDRTASVELIAALLDLPAGTAAAGALTTLAELCGDLPLALRLAGARVGTGAHNHLETVLAELAGTRRLDRLSVEDGDTAVRATFSLSYRALPAPIARAFRLLGLTPSTGEGLGTPAVAALLGLPDAEAAGQIGLLVAASMVMTRPDARHDLHDLLRLYAQERVETEETPTDRDEALRRLVGWYVRTADGADRHLSAARTPLRRSAAASGDSAAFADRPAALSWFAAESGTLPALIRVASELGLDDAAWQLAESQIAALLHVHDTSAMRSVSELGAAAARRAGHLPAEAMLVNCAATADVLAGRREEGAVLLRRAATLHERAGNPAGVGIALMNLGCTRSDQGRYDEALAELQRALGFLEQGGHPAAVGMCSLNLGEAFRRRGELGPAEGHLRRAVELTRQAGDHRDLAFALENLAEVLGATGRSEEALDCLGAALDSARAIQDRLAEGRVYAGRGDVLHAAGDRPAALPAWRAAVAILDEIGSPEAERVRARLQPLQDGAVR